MPLFNRTRERVNGTFAARILLKRNDGWPTEVRWPQYGCWSYPTEQVSKERIRDLAPVGKYKPGVFKITEVERCKIESQTSKINAEIQNPTDTVPSARVEEYYTYPLAITGTDEFIGVVPSQFDCDNLATIAMSKANGPSVGVGETFAEAGSSLRMACKPLASLAALFRQAFFTANGMRTAVEAANVWLELRYGWTPLVSTLHDLISGLPVYNVNDLFDSHAVGKRTIDDPPVGPYYRTLKNGDGYQLRVTGYQRREIVKRFQAYYLVRHKDLFAATRLGMSVFQLPQLLYELTKLSFALDWWFNLGDWIAASCPNPGLKELGWTYSEKHTVTTTNVVDAVGIVGTYCGPAHGRHIHTNTVYIRQFAKRPTLSPNLDTGFNSLLHAFDAVGLIFQRVPKSLRK